ncbi:MAG TPA: aspartate aminotransferase family protein [Candidatus Paceibacterota bacterium]|nr:aspartate aminotransferase family protein [Verrucomicrobiota bacterium]HRZ91829.1 aspartate aminotransferase family protein [Candidatus Paceibacterota bacterium]
MKPDASADVLALLRQFECRTVTFVPPEGPAPIVWRRARGCRIWDLEGRSYLDLTAAFGVAAAGHANPRVVAAAHRQMRMLLHAMGDVHPHALKASLARELSRITFERWSAPEPDRRTGRDRQPPGVGGCGRSLQGKTLFGNSGFEAVEAALKTAMMATGRRGVLAFAGGYHGLGYGTLNVTHRDLFRKPFLPQLGGFGVFLPYPERAEDLQRIEALARGAFRRRDIGAILVEPVQGRGGIRVPPVEFLPLLRELATRHSALLVLDEVYTGFGRTGRWFAAEHSGVIPDLVCLGKAMTGGFPLSACVGRADLMDAAWPPSEGEAIHTSTFLGHPVGCAMALAQIREIRDRDLVSKSRQQGRFLLDALEQIPAPGRLRLEARGLGLMAGLELVHAGRSPATAETLALIQQMLESGYILLPEGAGSNVVSWTPPLTITRGQLADSVAALAAILPRIHRTRR